MTVSNHENSQADQTRLQGRGTRRKFFRYGAVLPLAALTTIGLSLTMASLIATEFTPQDKSETAEFEINPVVKDIPNTIQRVVLELPDPVEVPPPPPKLPIAKVAITEAPVVDVPGKKVEIDLEELVFNPWSDVTIFDKDPTPILRIPPVFPNRFSQGNVSGYCRVRFDISPDGKPYNVVATICTNRQLERPTIRSVQKWKYTPEIQNGHAVKRSGVETTIRFDLKDEHGKVLPVPNGY